MGNVCAMLLGSGADDSDAESAESAPLVVAPREPHSATLIFLHGLGDTGHGWRGALADLGLPGLKVVLPTAAERRVTLNGGMRMPAWFDIHGLTPDAPQDKRGIAAAAGLLAGLVERELAAGVPAERVEDPVDKESVNVGMKSWQYMLALDGFAQVAKQWL